MSGPTLPPPKGEEFTPPPLPQHMASAPELPALNDSDIVTLFVLPPSSGDTGVDGDNMSSFDFDRLAFLGSGAIQFAITTYLFYQESLSSIEVETLRQELTKPGMWAQWASLYGNFADLGHGLSDEVAESARIFSAYVGGLYKQNGIAPVETWIQKLILHPTETTSLNSPAASPKGKGKGKAVPSAQEAIVGPSSSGVSSPKLQHASTGNGTPKTPTQTPSQSRKRDREVDSDEEGPSSPSPKRTRVSSSAATSVERRIASRSSASTARATSSAPILGQITSLFGLPADISTAGSSGSLTPAGAVARSSTGSSSQPQKKWMSVLNEACMVVRASRKWTTESEGADHLKTWRAMLTVPELDAFAIGEGKTKKIAQEDAARQVCEQLNWTQEYRW